MSHVQVPGSCPGWVVAPMPSLDPCSVTYCQRAVPPSLFPGLHDQNLFNNYGPADKSTLHQVATQWSSSFSAKTSPGINQPEPKSSADSPMGKPPSIETVRAVVADEIPDATIITIRPAPVASPRRFYNITLSDGRCLVLNLSPLTTTRLFRSEHSLAQSEATVIQWLTSTTLTRSEDSVRHRQHPSPAPTNSTTQQGSRDNSPRPLNSGEVLLSRVLPTLITHTISGEKLGTPFNLVETVQSLLISSLNDPLAPAQRNSINFEKGRLARCLADLPSPNSRFGTALTILRPAPSPPSSPPSWSQEPTSGHEDVQRWKEAFHAMLESALRDGEDMGVMMTYSRIRGHFRRLSHVLNRVTQPRLVSLHHCSDENTLITSPPEEHKPIISDSEKLQPSQYRLVGLQDWSNCVFADPLLAIEFNQETSSQFLRGFGILPESPLWQSLSHYHDLPEESGPRSIPVEEDSTAATGDLIEDPASAHIRLLLYECYHAVVDLVRQFYRPTKSSDREMAARRRLTRVLRQLEETNEVFPRASSPASVEAKASSPLKESLSPKPTTAGVSNRSPTLQNRPSPRREVTIKKEPDSDDEEHHTRSSSSSESETDDNTQEAKRSRRPSVDETAHRPQKRPKSTPDTPVKEEE